MTDKNSSEKEQNMSEERENLISKFIATMSRRPFYKDPLNIAIIGGPGCGKSSFINSFAASIATDNWKEYAFSGKASNGHRSAEQVTCRMKSFEASTYCTRGVCLPTLIDLPGFQSEEGEVTEEVLRLLMYGKLKENNNINAVYKFGKKWGTLGMRLWYSLFSRQVSRKIDRVIFLATAKEEIPQMLTKCLIQAARPKDDIYCREIPVFGVLTHCDLVDKSSDEFQERKRVFMANLGLGGAGHRFTECVNYCDDADPSGVRSQQTLPKLDVPILRFMNVVCGSNYEVTNTEEGYTRANMNRLKVKFTARVTESFFSVVENLTNRGEQRTSDASIRFIGFLICLLFGLFPLPFLR